jgi:hypothetical protein
MVFYKRFCCTLYLFLRNVGRSTIPVFATFMLTLFLFMLFFYGLDTLCFLFFDTPYIFEEYYMYIVLALFGIPNYFLVFKDSKFLDYETKPLHPLLTLGIVVLIFGGSLALILYAGPRNLPAQ